MVPLSSWGWNQTSGSPSGISITSATSDTIYPFYPPASPPQQVVYRQPTPKSEIDRLRLRVREVCDLAYAA